MICIDGFDLDARSIQIFRDLKAPLEKKGQREIRPNVARAKPPTDADKWKDKADEGRRFSCQPAA
jgi:hypothetical protein